MPAYSKKQDFFETIEGLEIKDTLEQLCLSDKYCTDSSYSPNTTNYSDNLMTFIDKHMSYIRSHPQIDPVQYVANLKLVTKRR